MGPRAETERRAFILPLRCLKFFRTSWTHRDQNDGNTKGAQVKRMSITKTKIAAEVRSNQESRRSHLGNDLEVDEVLMTIMMVVIKLRRISEY